MNKWPAKMKDDRKTVPVPEFLHPDDLEPALAANNAIELRRNAYRSATKTATRSYGTRIFSRSK
jgi:hypothetical protein